MKQEAMRILSAYGYTGPSAEECAEEWSRKQVVTWGIVKFYEAYYNK